MILQLETENSCVKKECRLYHDINGNIIAQLVTPGFMKTKSRYFRLDIDKDNKPVFTRVKNMIGMYSIVDGKISYNKIQNVLENSLKKKVIDSIDPHNENINHDELEEDEDYIYEKTLYVHLPEMKNYYTESIEGDEDMLNYNDDDIIFRFNSNSNISTLPQFYKTFESAALYDVLVKNDNMIVFSSEATPYSSYIILINEIGNIFELNVIGSSVCKYKLKYIKKNLVFENNIYIPEGLVIDYSSDSESD